jgi:hypothetical protein
MNIFFLRITTESITMRHQKLPAIYSIFEFKKKKLSIFKKIMPKRRVLLIHSFNEVLKWEKISGFYHLAIWATLFGTKIHNL